MARPPAPDARTLVPVRVQPRASRAAVDGWHNGALRVRVTAAPVDGEANRAVLKLLAGALGVPPAALTLVRGERGRDKLVRVRGVSAEVVAARTGRIDAEGVAARTGRPA